MNQQKRVFYALSEVLTGFSEVDLLGTGVGEQYLHTIKSIVGEVIFEELLMRFKSIEEEYVGKTKLFHKKLRTDLLSDPKLGPLARNVIKVWYLGNWYKLPDLWWQTYGPERDKTFVVSSQAYIESLVWQPMEAHPMGAKQPGYGTWSLPPEPESNS